MVNFVPGSRIHNSYRFYKCCEWMITICDDEELARGGTAAIGSTHPCQAEGCSTTWQGKGALHHTANAAPLYAKAPRAMQE
jgi:hypothetical protein